MHVDQVHLMTKPRMLYTGDMKKFVTLPKLKPEDQVAIISPSAGLPGLFPWVQDLGLRRLKEEFGLIPKEYPTTRQMDSSLKDRARDIMAAFSDPENKAVIASIGGSDQIKLIKYLDPDVFLNNPKPFFGSSDNTHLQIFLWNLGILSFYGGCIMTQFAMQASMDQLTTEYLKKALFETGEYELKRSDYYNDIGRDWSDEANLAKQRTREENEPWSWYGKIDTEGALWGGCVESLVVQMSTAKYLPADDDLGGTILFLETAEDIPEHWIIEYLLTGMGERGWLSRFNGILIGRPKAWEFDKQNSAEAKAAYRKEQRETVLRTIREYNPDIPVIQNLDFGHTDPQVPLPNGQNCRIDSKNKKIYLTF